MKKNKLFLIALLLVANLTFAQTFFVPTTYRGAFAPAPAAMWTNTWTNWDPQNATYPSADVTVATNITSNTTWTNNHTYLLHGQIYVTNGATLTIQAGTKILGDKSSTGAGLFITKGAKLIAIGTASQPIVFTSNQAKGSRSIGDWGGVILLGKASYNNNGGTGGTGTGNIEGIAPSSLTEFGGGTNPDDDDNSGTLQYVRIEFGGYVYQPNKEINGLTFGAVGRGTTIDHVQVSFANDDAFEWFGGTVNCRYLVAYRNLDDDFDTDNGFSGKVQFALTVRDPNIADNPSVSTSEGFESDNDANGSTLTPQTKAIFSNVTLIGPLRGNASATIASGYRRGARIRRNSALKIYNSIFMDYLRGVHIDGALCEGNTGTGATALKFRNNILAGIATLTEVNSGSTFNITNWFNSNNNNVYTSTSGILTTPYNYTAPDYRPATGSAALSNADFTDNSLSGLVLFAPAVPADTLWYCKYSTIPALTATASASCTLRWYASAIGGTPSLTAPTPSNTSTKTYYVAQLNNYGVESARRAIVVIINPLVTTPVSISGKTVDICFNTPVKYYVTTPVANATSYSWTLPAHTSIVSTSAMGDTAYVSFDNTYVVDYIRVAALNSCGTSVMRSLKVAAYPTATGLITGPTVVCNLVGTSTTATYTVPALAGANYAWTLPTGVNMIANNGNSIDVTFASNFASSSIYVANQGTCQSSTSRSLHIYKSPLMLASNVISGPTTVCASGATQNYSINTVNGATTYTWTAPSGASIVSGQGTQNVSVLFTNATAATMNLACKTTNACGTSATRLFAITRDTTCRVAARVANTVSSNENQVAIESSISVFPNPVVDNAIVRFTSSASQTIQAILFDALGKQISVSSFSASAGQNNLTLPVAELAGGVYTIRLINADGSSSTVRFVK